MGALRRCRRHVALWRAVAGPCSVLNADFDSDTYSARHIEIISDYVARHAIPRADVAAWAADLHERAQRTECFFSLNRYVFTARKAISSSRRSAR